MTELDIVASNVRGLAEFNKRREIFHFFHLMMYNLILLQETHSTKVCKKRWRLEWGGNIYHLHSTSDSKGVAIIFGRNKDKKYSTVRNIKISIS